MVCANSSLYKDHVSSQNANELFNQERTMGGQLISAVDSKKSPGIKVGVQSTERTERSDDSSKMVYSDAETQIHEHVVPTKYNLPQLSKNLVKNKKKIQYKFVDKQIKQKGKPTPTEEKLDKL
jgi:basic membrane lipoprotein Med (substrate-binding protein (PBP1-ABC) superfamily)